MNRDYSDDPRDHAEELEVVSALGDMGTARLEALKRSCALLNVEGRDFTNLTWARAFAQRLANDYERSVSVMQRDAGPFTQWFVLLDVTPTGGDVCQC